MRHALLELRQHPGRLLAVVLAITISVAFLVASLVFTATETRAIGHSVTAATAPSDVVVDTEGDAAPGLQAKIAAVAGGSSVEATFSGSAEFGSTAGAGELQLVSLPQNPQLMWARLTAGTWPSNPDEIAVDRTTAKQYRLAVGQQITFSGHTSEPDPTMRVTGITDQSRSLFSGLTSTAFVAPVYFTSRPELRTPYRFLVLDRPGTSPEAVAHEIAAVAPAGTTVQTSAEVTAAALRDLTHGADVFRYLLLVFGGIALLVGSILIANTFTILLTQRRRQIGLLRAVGASTAQVRGEVLAEAVVVGVVGSLLGVALGIVVGLVAAAVTGSLGDGLAVPLPSVLASALVGLVVTVLSALIPAARTTRIAPLEALRPVADEVTAKRASARLRNLSFLVMAVGTALVIVSLRASAHNVELAIGSCMIVTVGVLLAAPTFLPAALRVAGRGVGLTGAVARLAGANTLRNPTRAAATCTALMLGVGLIVTLQVGAASVKSTVNDTFDVELPVDVMVTNPAGALSPGVLNAVRSVPGLAASSPVRMTSVDVGAKGPGQQRLQVAGLTPDVGRVVSAGFGQLTDQVVLAKSETLRGLEIASGHRMTLRSHHHAVTLTALASDIPAPGALAVTDRTLSALDPGAPVAAVWASATDRTQAATIIADVRKASGQQAGLEIGGSLSESAALTKVLDSLLTVATGLLGVAVLIALIGVGNTLGLSVIERTRESALLRALGLQRRELRLMLAVEAALLALVGAVVGVAAGVIFGLIGTAAVVKETRLDAVRFSMSGSQTLSVVGVALVAGVLASVLPGRRAALADPTEALAEV